MVSKSVKMRSILLVEHAVVYIIAILRCKLPKPHELLGGKQSKRRENSG